MTGTRAEYGLLQWIMRDVAAHPGLALSVIATGAHLEDAFGRTVDLIREDGIPVDASVNMQLDDDSPPGIARSMGLCVTGMAEAFARIEPDVVVLLGDRYETLAAATAALVSRIPIAHLHGGEVTSGALDDSMRHAITKLSALHYVACAEYERRVIQMGEDPARVHDVGAVGIDSLNRLELLDSDAVLKETGLSAGRPLLLATYHPVTTRPGGGVEHVGALLDAFDRVDANVILTKSNADEGGQAINARLDAWAAQHADRARVYTTMGHSLYLSALRAADVVVGNSSSGLLEVPATETATVNVGPRQDGRVRAPSVLDCTEDADAIAEAIGTALDPAWRAKHVAGEHPFGDGHATERIVEDLARVDLTELVVKRFVDRPGGTS